MKRLVLSVIAAVALVLGLTTPAHAYYDCTYYDGYEACYWYDDPPPPDPWPWELPWWWTCFGVGCTYCDPCEA